MSAIVMSAETKTSEKKCDCQNQNRDTIAPSQEARERARTQKLEAIERQLHYLIGQVKQLKRN